MEQRGERLHKVMARSGVGSRRACEKVIMQGRVKVNGSVVTNLGTTVTKDDIIEVDGKLLDREPVVYYAVHKPVGYISSARDERGRKVVVSLVPRTPRVYPVGRLDMDTSGLILLTNDGDLAYALMHPKFEVPKVYLAKVAGDVDESIKTRLLEGIELEDGPARADEVDVLKRGAISMVRLRVHEGRNRLVRRMFDAVGRPVRELIRESIGPLTLSGLAPGEFRRLTGEEVIGLYRSAGIARTLDL